jgi:hypothetical protein
MVPGIIFSNHSFSISPQPSYRDIPVLAIGKDLEHPSPSAPGSPSGSGEDQAIIEERLKGLGYL